MRTEESNSKKGVSLMGVSVMVQVSETSMESKENSATIPFLLGFVIGLVLPVAMIFIYKSFDVVMSISVKGFSVAIHNPMIVVWSVLISCLSMVLFYMTYCYMVVKSKESEASIVESKLDLVKQCVAETFNASRIKFPQRDLTHRNITISLRKSFVGSNKECEEICLEQNIDGTTN